MAVSLLASVHTVPNFHCSLPDGLALAALLGLKVSIGKLSQIASPIKIEILTLLARHVIDVHDLDVLECRVINLFCVWCRWKRFGSSKSNIAAERPFIHLLILSEA
jgi:hypothetical protein